MRKIVIYPAEILRQKPVEIKNIDKKLLGEIEDLKKILKNGKNAAGLAALQIGVNKRFFGSKEISSGETVVYLNPKIEKSYGEKIFPKIIDENKKEGDFLEGCLSFPNYFGTVKRWLKIDVSWDEIKTERLERKYKSLSGFDAIVWQHESDHLDGIVFIDHIDKDKGKFLKEIDGKMVNQSLKIFQ